MTYIREDLIDDPLMTPGEIAAYLRINAKTVTRWVLAGKLDAIKTPGGHVRVRKSVVMAAIAGDPS